MSALGRMARCSILIASLPWGCGQNGGEATPENKTPFPPQQTDTETTTSTSTDSEATGMTGGACTDSSDCTASVCAGPHTTGQTRPPASDTFSCTCANAPDCCIPLQYAALWCVDDAGCCSGVCNEATGYCIDPGATDTTPPGTDTGTGTTDTDTGTTTDTDTTTTTTG